MRGKAEHPAALPQPTADGVQVIHLFFQEHYRQTLDDPMPGLGGKTLRQAVRTNKDRKEAVVLLKRLANIEDRRVEQHGHRAYDTGWIWQELGIQRPAEHRSFLSRRTLSL